MNPGFAYLIPAALYLAESLLKARKVSVTAQAIVSAKELLGADELLQELVLLALMLQVRQWCVNEQLFTGAKSGWPESALLCLLGIYTEERKRIKEWTTARQRDAIRQAAKQLAQNTIP